MSVAQITQPEADAIRKVLWSIERIPVGVCITRLGEVDVYPVGRELSTLEEVTALRAFAAVTDAPLYWCPGVA